jgi:hypothetical protein
MATIKTYPMQNSAILRLNFIKNRINVNPIYQRKGEVWTLEKKQLLIDSILNDYDLPKLYFHLLSQEQKAEFNGQYDYALVDGRQRLEAIWEFIEDKWSLDVEFEYFADPSLKVGGLRYGDLAISYPQLKVLFDSFNLPIVLVETEDVDLIEDMFSRLNEAVPLNAAEKRNALGGPMAQAIREVAEHSVFRDKVRFANKRYQHREVSARLLFIEYSLEKSGRLYDTKKPYLDNLVKIYREHDQMEAQPFIDKVVQVLNVMNNIFVQNDELLRTQSSIPVLYLVIKSAAENGNIAKVTRAGLTAFFARIVENRQKAEHDITQAEFEFLEFERLSQQGTNDAASIRERVKVMCNFLGVPIGEFLTHDEKLLGN